jgi:small-conductance mechanosensitive channel
MLMKARQWVVSAALLTLVVGAAVALILTRQSAQPASSFTTGRRPPLVDERPVQTARAMSALASDRDEQRFAQQALKLADHEVDLAFTDGLRDATEHPAPPTPQTKELLARASRADAAVKKDQDKITQLKKDLAQADATKKDTLQQQIDFTQAQLELDQDEQEDAKGDLIRSGVDKLSRIQRQFNRHESAQHEFETTHAQPGAANAEAQNYRSDTLVPQFLAWRALQGNRVQIEKAKKEAEQSADSLNQTHEALDQRVAAEQAGKQDITQQAANEIRAAAAKPSDSENTATNAIASLHQLAVDQKDLADLNKRIQDQQEIANVYANWLGLVRSHQHEAVHGMIQSVLLIALILLAVYLAGRLVDHFFVGLPVERTRLHTLRVVIKFAMQALGVLLILFVIIGTPSQMPTILGLAGAGLTVALKDFIVAFVGWFVLMGRNGLRVGDWVEINGVVGEVVEINLWHTVLLETGNWTDTGHPTGRKVAFMNSFAIEGHFFNFSTSGQWLWDEVEIMVPSDQNPYPIIDAIQKMVQKETQANAQSAEREWQKATSHYRVHSVSAAPAINLRPTTAGVEVHVRYITRASERYATRTKLYQALVELLHKRHAGTLAESSAAVH